MGWTLDEAVRLCRLVEAVAPPHGCHVALTGGCLYKAGERKDLDLLFYRVRQVEKIDWISLLESLETIGFSIVGRHGWVVKAKYNDKPIDIFFPETPDKIEIEDNHTPSAIEEILITGQQATEQYG
jgi:hypothetical protein